MIKKQEYVIESDKQIEDKTVAVVSDMHISDEKSSNKVSKVLNALEKIKPTHIVIPGDLYNVNNHTMGSNQVADFIKNAADIADVFYVRGNSELKWILLPQGLGTRIKDKRIHLLCEDEFELNRGVSIESSVSNAGDMNVAAIKLPKDFYSVDEPERTKILLSKYKKRLEELSKHCGEENFNILLCHDPIIKDTLDQMDINFDLVVSGHNHGGLFPEYMKGFFKMMGADIPKLYPTYTKGMLHCGNGHIVVSEGITKFHSETGKLQKFEKFHTSTIETIKVYSKQNNRLKY